MAPSSAPSLPQTVGAGWARERLWLGMSNVGFWVVVSIVGVVMGAPDLGGGLWDVGVLLAGVVAIQAAFDGVGGFLLQHRHGRDTRSLGAFALAWLRGTLVHTLFIVLAGASLWAATAWLGPMGAGLSAGVLSLFILAFQLPLLRLTGGLRPRRLSAEEAAIVSAAGIDPEVVRTVDAHDSSYVGGWLGLPGLERLVVPTHWQTELSRSARYVQARRRALTRASGQRLRGVLVAWLWTVIGATLAASLVGGADADGLVRMVCFFTLWSFLAVLVLPTISRLGVYAVDAMTLQDGIDPAELDHALYALDALQDDEPARSEVVETIFHPVPALDRRRKRARTGHRSAFAAWHAARMALLMGWSMGTPLSRAVHCNIGRPELWAVFPGD